MTTVVRLGMAVLAVLNLWWGVWARLWPRPFFDTFPGFGHHWTAAYPPYNAHLVADLGSTFLTLGLLLAAAALVNDPRLRWLALAGVLVFNVSHLTFHAVDHGRLTGPDLTGSLATLMVGVVGPLALLGLDLVTTRGRVGADSGRPG